MKSREAICKPGVLLVLASLATALNAATAWKMLQFHRRLAALENPQWERTLSGEHVYQRPVVMFGDSEIAKWPMATSFGLLPVINRGVGGDEAMQAQERLDREVLPLKPSAVVILIGTNDIAHGQSPAVVLAAIGALVASVRSVGAEVILCSLLPSAGDAAAVRPPRAIRAVNEGLQGLADGNAGKYVDLGTLVTDRNEAFAKEFSDDGLHSNAAGYVRMTKALLPVLLESLRRQEPAHTAR